MKKSDLKTGMLVKIRSGEIGLVALDNCCNEDAIIFSGDYWTDLNGFNEDLFWHHHDPNRSSFAETVDIMVVYKPNLPPGFLSRRNLEVLWRRAPEKTFELDGITYSESTLRSIIKKSIISKS